MQEKNMDLRQAVASVNGGKATKLPQEVEEGNTEYKLKLVGVGPERRTRLASQMHWRLNEAPSAAAAASFPSSSSSLSAISMKGGEALYMLGYQDDGSPVGLSDDDLVTSLCTLRAIAATINAEVFVVAVRWGSGIQTVKPSMNTIPTKVAEVRVHRSLLFGGSDLGGDDGCASSGASTTSGNSSSVNSSASSSSSDDDDFIDECGLHEEQASSSTCLSETLRRSHRKLLLPMVVAAVGDAAVGKTTLAAVLTTGELDNGRGLARMQVLRHHHEIADEGHTSSRAPVLLAFDADGGVANFDERVVETPFTSSREASATGSPVEGCGQNDSVELIDAEAEVFRRTEVLRLQRERSSGIVEKDSSSSSSNSTDRNTGGDTGRSARRPSKVPAWGTLRNNERCKFGPGFGNICGSGDGSGGGSGSFISSSFSATELLAKASAEGLRSGGYLTDQDGDGGSRGGQVVANGGRLVEVLDLAGHRKYLKTTVAGLVHGNGGSASPDYVMLVVDALAACEMVQRRRSSHQEGEEKRECSGPRDGDFFWPLGTMGLEHMGIARALGLRLFIVVTKCELCPSHAKLAAVLKALEHAVSRSLNAPHASVCGRPLEPVRVRCRDDLVRVCTRLASSSRTAFRTVRPGLDSSRGQALTPAVRESPVPVPVPIIAVSAVTGAGMGLLRELLFRLPPNPQSASRAIDRLFDGCVASSKSLVSHPNGPPAAAAVAEAKPAKSSAAAYVRVDGSFEVDGAPGLVLAGAVQVGTVGVGAEFLLGPFARRRAPLGSDESFATAAGGGDGSLPRSMTVPQEPSSPLPPPSVAEAESNAPPLGSPNSSDPPFFRRVRVTSIHLHGVAVAHATVGQVATFAVSVARPEDSDPTPPDVWALDKRCRGMVLVGYNDSLADAPPPQVVLEFDAEVVLFPAQSIAAPRQPMRHEILKVDHEPMIYVGSVTQTVRIASVHVRDSRHSSAGAMSSPAPPPAEAPQDERHVVMDVRFQFLHRPEFVTVGDWLFFRDASRGVTSNFRQHQGSRPDGGNSRMGIGRITRCHVISASDCSLLVDHSRGPAAVRHRTSPLLLNGPAVVNAAAPDFWG